MEEKSMRKVIIDGETLTFSLTVQGGQELQDSSDVDVTVEDNGITGFPDEAISCYTTTGLPIGMQCAAGNITQLNIVDP
jgi:hypothetical protein